MDKNTALREQLAEAQKKLSQLQNRKKILLNRVRGEERRTRNHRVIQHGLLLEGVFPAAINANGETIRAFLIALSRLPGATELAEKTLDAEDKD